MCVICNGMHTRATTKKLTTRLKSTNSLEKKMKDKKNHPIKLIIHRYLFIFTIFTMNNKKNDE